MEAIKILTGQLIILVFLVSILGWMTAPLVNKKVSLFWFPAQILKAIRKFIKSLL